MCFYRENQLFAKRNFAKLAQLDKTVSGESKIQDKTPQETSPEDEALQTKKKILDEKAPGLFDFLSRLSQEDDSTEATSEVTSDSGYEEAKQAIYVPTPIKITKIVEDVDLSNPVKVRPYQPVAEVYQIPQLDTQIIQKEFQSQNIFEEAQRQRILGLMNQNTLLLNSIIASQDATTEKLMRCVEELKEFRKEFSEENKSQLEKIEQLKEQKKVSGNFDSNPNPQTLFNHFFGTGKIYRYELVLDGELPSPIFRERNLIIKVKVLDILTKEPVKNFNKLVLHLSMHSWEIPSNPIIRNKSGNKAIMGDTEVELKNGEGLFDRIQINEVTSKFIHGHVAMLVIPSKPCNVGTSLIEQALESGYVDFEAIKPLMLEKVVVKSKKKNQKKKDE